MVAALPGLPRLVALMTVAIRKCPPISAIPLEQCLTGRCEIRQCQVCGQDVHYDPGVIHECLGGEVIMCNACVAVAFNA